MASSAYQLNPPLTQALATKTFVPPPLDGSLALPEVYDWHLKNSPFHPLYVFPLQDGTLRTILWPEAVRAVYTGAKLVRGIMGWKPGMSCSRVVSILSSSEAISYSTLSMAIIRAGYIVFPISPRNSAPAIAHLISKVGVAHLFLGRDQAMSDLWGKAIDVLNREHSGTHVPGSSPIPIFEELYTERTENQKELDEDLSVPFEKKGPGEVAMYLHTSGSSSFPKPIAWTNYRVAQLALTPYFGERDMTGMIFSVHNIPGYHTMGMAQILFTSSSGIIISTFAPKLPPTIPTAHNIFEAAQATKTNLIFCVPSIVEEWSKKPEYVGWLSTIDGVLFGGGPLSKSVGNDLISKGVPLFNMYGSTEMGAMTPFIPGQLELDWEYFKISDMISVEMVSQGNETYECFGIAGPFCDLSVVNAKLNGVDAFATSDLFTQHPKRPGYWKVYGRVDDQIMHSTGEKTNPGPLERIINLHPYVKSCVIFGRGQFHAGVIVDLEPEARFDAEDKEKLADFRDTIWPVIQQMNDFAPQHSRIFKDMIIVSKTSKPFAYTAKNTPRRHVIIDDYAEEIKILYDTQSILSSSTEIILPDTWEFENVLAFVRTIVNNSMAHEVDDGMDIFQHGYDSLQATRLRNTILGTLSKVTTIMTQNLDVNFIYEHPTISSLASFLVGLACSTDTHPTSAALSHINEMRNMVSKYTTQYSTRTKLQNTTSLVDVAGEVILVTGTTGSLGSHLLAELVETPDVTCIYAVNRRSVHDDPYTLEYRQKQALLKIGLEADKIMSSSKVILVEADTSCAFIGVEESLHQQMCSSITHIIHNAWPVDFNLSLQSFEESIKGLRNLIDLALSSFRPKPPTIVFTSSIAVVQNVKSPHTFLIPESPVPVEAAVGSGYMESKWVSEEILRFTSDHSAVKSVIVRVGQLTGSLNGSWNSTEWFPSLIKSAQVLGCFPTDNRYVDWIPVSLAARALIEFRESESAYTIVHLVHPKPTSWHMVAGAVALDLDIRLIPFSEWLEKLERTGNDTYGKETDIDVLRSIPALRLLGFFRSLCAETSGTPNPACSKAVRLSKTLNCWNMPQLVPGSES